MTRKTVKLLSKWKAKNGSVVWTVTCFASEHLVWLIRDKQIKPVGANHREIAVKDLLTRYEPVT